MLPHAKQSYRQRLEVENWERENGIEETFVILENSQECSFISPGSALSPKNAL